MDNTIKKVAIIADPLDLQSAGIYVYLKMLVQGLSNKDGVEYHLIRAQEGPIGNHLKNIVIPHWKLPGAVMARKWFTIPAYVNKNNYAIVIEPAHFGPFRCKENIKRVTVIHDLTPIFFPEFHPINSVIAHRLFLRRIIKKADLIITNSNHTLTDVATKYIESKNKIKTIYPSVNPAISYKPDDAVLLKHGILKPFFLSVGTIEPRKDYITTVKAFELYKSKHKESENQLVIIGRSGWHSQALFDYIKSSAHRHDIIILNDLATDDLPAFYSQCELFIMSSIYEGFGFPLLEAHNCGAICLCSSTSSLKEIGESFAYYFEPHNHKQLAQLMARHKNNERIGDIEAITHSKFAEKFHNEIVRLLRK